MRKNLKIFAMVTLLTGATVTAARASAIVLAPTAPPTPPYAVETLAVQLTATYTFQDPATTNRKDGTITDAKGMVSINTGKFLELLATNLGVTLNKKGASLIKVTELAEGINFTNVITNSPTLVSNTTFLETNKIYTTFVFSNTIPTNGNPLYVTNSSDSEPAGYTLILATNFTTNLVQASGDTVIVGTNVTYYLNNGPGLDPTNFVPFGARSNDNASVTASAGDDAGNLLWRYVIIDALGHQYFSQGVTSNFFLAEELTNHGHIFAGTIKTNLDINGTLYTDSIAIRMGPPRDPGSAPNFPPAPPELILSGTANASASPATTAIVTNKLPFSSWNATYAVTGYGTVGGVVSNNFYTNNYTYLTTSNVEVLSVNPSLPNPPYTNISTNLYTNYTVINTTNSGFVVKGTVQQTFWKIVQH